MTAVDRKVFREYYSDLLKDLKDPKQMNQNRAEIIDTLTKTFDALGSLNQEVPKDIVIKGKTIPIHEMGPKELQIFAEFAKKFLQKEEMNENHAEILREKIPQAKVGLETVSTKGTWFGEDQKLSALKNLSSARNQILLHEKTEDKPEIDVNDVSVNAKNHINRLLRTEQTKALELERKLKEVQRKITVLNTVFYGLTVTGLLVALIGIPFAASAFIAAGLVLLYTGAGIMAAGVFAKGSNILFREQESKIEKNFNASFAKLERLEEYKKFINQENFVKFTNENKYANFKDNDEKFLQFMDLYVLQQKYDRGRLELDRKFQERNFVGLEAKSVEVEKNFKEINDLRAKLGLDPLVKQVV